MAIAETVKNYLSQKSVDCEPVAIPPIELASQIDIFLDEALTTLASVYLEAGDHELVLGLAEWCSARPLQP